MSKTRGKPADNQAAGTAFRFKSDKSLAVSKQKSHKRSATDIYAISGDQSILQRSKSDVSCHEDIVKLTGIDFDESVYRTDGSKSDEEFLEPRFLEDLEKRLQERDKQYRRRTLNRERQGTSLRNTNDTVQTRESNLAYEAKEHIVQEVLNRRKELPILKGFLDKMSPAMHSRWQRRWVLVLDYTIMYFREEVDVSSREEAKNHCCLNELPLTTVEKITKDDKCKGGDRFEVAAQDPRTGKLRQYVWRCKDAELCNYWVHGLAQHKDQALAELKIGARSRTSIMGMTGMISDLRKNL